MIIPFTLIGIGTGCIVKGGGMVYRQLNADDDVDSVDKRAFDAGSDAVKNVFEGVSEFLSSFVVTANLDPDDGTLEVKLEADAPPSAGEIISRQAHMNEDVQAVDIQSFNDLTPEEQEQALRKAGQIRNGESQPV